MQENENGKRRLFSPRVLIAAILLVLTAVLLVYFIFFSGKIFSRRVTVDSLVSPVDFDADGIDDYADFLFGAKKDAEVHPVYDARYWETAYPPENIGVCSDVCWRAFREAGYCLRDMVDYDVNRRPEAYPNIEEPDNNIDFRRVVNLKVFFEKYAIVLTADPDKVEEWMPGDLVFFGTEDGTPNHFGLVSDKRTREGVPYILHNAGQLQREQNILHSRTIVGHYRFNAENLPNEILIAWHDGY